VLQEEKDALDDLATELELADEDELIPCVHTDVLLPRLYLYVNAVLTRLGRYKLQSSFLHLPATRVLELVQAAQDELDASLSSLEDEAENAQGEMGKLKAKLYAKFGSTSSHVVLCNGRELNGSLCFHRRHQSGTVTESRVPRPSTLPSSGRSHRARRHPTSAQSELYPILN
jgi:hypothetical protein